jgi:hypothetical protein
METAGFSKDDLNLKIDICVPADDVERPVELIPNPDNIMFDFITIVTKPARKYVRIIIENIHKYGHPTYDEHTFDIENEEDAHRIIKEFIVKKEKSPELVFGVGFCKNPRCVKWLESETCCKHRIASFNYDEDYTYIIGYSDTIYKIQIIL